MRNPDKRDVFELYDRLAHLDRPPKRGLSGWLERRDSRLLIELLQPRPNLSLLDVGCGLGVHARLFQRAGMRVCATDVVPRLVERVRPDVHEAVLADIEHLDLGRSFDRVLCFGVLDFIADAERSLVNLARHVAPGGRLVIEVPRMSIGGLVYRFVYPSRSIAPRLYRSAVLDAWAARAGLEADGRAQPFPHSMLLAWKRQSVKVAAG
jgi:2-polyprenyl-3-methyl-5-hydroxy-6-metoxy-1,4-benzoquinol methylase